MSNSKQYNQNTCRQDGEYYYDPRQNSGGYDQKSGSYHDNYYNESGYNNHSGENMAENTQPMASDKFGDMTVYELANNNTFMIIGYLLCWPFCLYLMWKYNNWSRTVKIVVSIICGLFGLGIIIKLVGAVGVFSLFL